MISLWYANPGEDFTIRKTGEEFSIITADMTEFGSRTLIGEKLPVVGKNAEVIYLVFAQRRLAFRKEKALKIMGEIAGKTETPPKILTAPAPCKCDCSKCGRCG